MRYTSVLFDFDGTLCDTGEGIMKSCQYALEQCGYDAPKDYKTLTCFIGPPLLVTFQEKYGASAEEAQILVQKFRERYNDKGIFESELYPNTEKMLSALKEDGLKIGVASSKPQPYIEKLLKKFGIDGYFDVICGVSFKADCESKASVIERCLKEMGSVPHDTLMVGDKNYDIAGAKANMLDSCGVMWGYGSKIEFINAGAKFFAERPMDVEAIALGFFEQTEEYEGIYSGKIITVHKDKISQVDGREASREIVEHPGGVAIAGVTDEGEILLVRQFRYAYKETILEIPAGKLEPNEDPFEAGKREFREECGATAKDYFSLGVIYPTPGYCSEKIYIYGATGISFGNQDLDEGELLDVIRMKSSDVIDKILSGEITDSKTIAAVLKLKVMGKI